VSIAPTGQFPSFDVGISSRALRHLGQLGQREFRVVGDENVGGVPCVQIGTRERPHVELWLGKSDKSLRRWFNERAVEWPPPPSDEVEADVEYTPTFDGAIAPARFAFAPSVERPLQDTCSERGVASDGSDPLIDDLEDGDHVLRQVDHRVGRWWAYGDEGCAVTGGEPEAPGGANPSTYAVRASARSCSTWGFLLGFALNEVAGSCAYDARAYDGISFWARSGREPETLTFGVGTRQTEPLEYGGDGSCETAAPQKRCWDYFSTALQLTPEWRAYSVEWATLKQMGFGVPATFDLAQLASLNWQIRTSPDEPGGEIWVDQVAFFNGAPPASRFTP